VNTYTTGGQSAATLALDGGGNFVVAWQSAAQDGSDVGVFGQRYETPVTPLVGRQLQIKDNADPAKRKVQFAIQDPGIDTTAPGGIDSATDGAYLHVYHPATGDSASFTLAKGGWTATGNPPSPAFKYADKTFASSACNTAQVKDAKLLKVSCQSKTKPISYTLNEPSQGSVTAVFGSGMTRYCTTFGGTVKKDVPNLFQAKSAPAPRSCPAPPKFCP
jgi:hypothetical protein